MTQFMKSVSKREESIVGKGENSGFQHFLHFSAMFSESFFQRVIESLNCVVKGLRL